MKTSVKMLLETLLTLSLVSAIATGTNTTDSSNTSDTNRTSHTNSTADTNGTTNTTSTTDTNVTMQRAANSPSETVLASPPDRYAEMIFDDLYHLVFSGNKMLKLQQCLCNSTVSSCLTTIKRPNRSTDYEYEFRANSTEAEVLDRQLYSGETFICHAGDFVLLEKFTCTRHADSFDRCSRQKNCRFVHFQSGDVQRCKSSSTHCINLGFSGYTVEFRNFTGLAEFKEGSCGATTTTTNAPETEGMLKQDAGVEDSLLIILAAIGWGLFILTVSIILFIYVCWKISKKNPQQKESVSEKSQVTHNESYGLQSINHGGGRNSVHPPPPPLQVKYEEATTNTEHQEDSPYQDCVEDDDVYTVIEDENGTERAEESTKTDDVRQKKSSLYGVPSVPNTENASDKTISQCEETNKAVGTIKRPNKNQVNSTVGHLQKDAAKSDSTDAEEDYTRLKNGRSVMDRKLTDSFLATYDAALEGIGDEISKSGEDEDNTINNLDDEEDGHSGCYMLLEPEEEDTLMRDSAGYTTVNKQRSIEAKKSPEGEPDKEETLLRDSVGHTNVSTEGSDENVGLNKEQLDKQDSVLRAATEYTNVGTERSDETVALNKEESDEQNTLSRDSDGYTIVNKEGSDAAKTKVKDGDEKKHVYIDSDRQNTLSRGSDGYTIVNKEGSGAAKTKVKDDEKKHMYVDNGQQMDAGNTLHEACNSVEYENGNSSDLVIAVNPYALADPIVEL